MTISNALMTAIMSFDTYNQGPERQILGDWSGVGTAIFLRDSLESDNSAYSFYGRAYLWNGQTVISYRGTDAGSIDALTGYGTGAGNIHGYPDSMQAQLALEFYRDVLGIDPDEDPRDSNVLLTGHSLGAGLAGYVAALYGQQALIFDNMPFEAAANNAAFYAPYQQDLRQSIYGNLSPWAVNTDYIVNVYIPAAGVVTNLLAAARDIPGFFGAGQTINQIALDLPPDTPLWWTTESIVGQRHDGALIIIRMFADEFGATDWRESARHFIPALFEQQIAGALNAQQYKGSNNDDTGVMRGAIAYSAIDQGTMPFGDAAIRALFNDVNQLGRFYEAGPKNQVLAEEAVHKALAEVAVQFAGDLALQKRRVMPRRMAPSPSSRIWG